MGRPLAELAATIAGRSPTIGVLFLTGYAAETLTTLDIDPRQVLNKPVSENALLNRVAELLPRRDR